MNKSSQDYNKLSDTERTGYVLSKALFGGDKVKIEVPGINQWNNEGPFSKNINPYEFKEGDEFYLDDSPIMSLRKDDWKKIRITGVRSGVLFYVFTRKPKKEEWMSTECLTISLGKIMPLKYVVDTKEFPREYYEFICRCPLTKIVYK